jgi:hypothetical protein
VEELVGLMSNCKDPVSEGVVTMNKGTSLLNLRTNVNVRGILASGFCTGVYVYERLPPRLMVGLGIKKSGQVKVNCNS